MTNPNDVLLPEEWDAPNAIPSAAAWITSPSVVEKERWECDCCAVCEGREEVDERSEREYIFWGPPLREEFVLGWRRGSVSRRYISMKPRIRESPIQA